MRIAQGILTALLLAGLLVSTGWTRVEPARPVVLADDGQVRLLGYDAYFHLRHAEYAAAHFPHVNRWDADTFYPTGLRAIHASLYDIGIAAAARARGGGERDVLVAAAWTPPLLMLGIVLAHLALAWRLWGRAAGLSAAVLLALYPGDLLIRSQLGFADHHVAEVFLAALSLLGLVHVLRTPPEATRAPWRLAGRAALGALPFAVFLYTWPGVPVYVLCFAAALGLGALLRGGLGHDIEGLAQQVRAYGLAFVALTAPPALLWPESVARDVIVWGSIAAMAGLALGLPVVAWAHARLRGRLGAPLAAGVLLLASLGAVGAAAAQPSLGAALRYTFTPRDPQVAEHASFAWKLAWMWMGPTAMLALVGALVTVSRALRRSPESDAARLAATLVACAFVPFAFFIRDYGYAVPLFTTLLGAAALHGLLRWTRPMRGAARLAILALATAVLVSPAWPAGTAPKPWLTTEAIRGSLLPIHDGWLDTLRWIRERTPAPTRPVGTRDARWTVDFAYPEGTYGVFAPWEIGHAMAAVGRRVPMTSHSLTPPNSLFLFAQTEEAAAAVLDEQVRGPERIRFVALDAETCTNTFLSRIAQAGLDEAPYRRAIARRLRGSTITVPVFGGAYERTMLYRLFEANGDGLSHYRLIHRAGDRAILFYRAEVTGLGDIRMERRVRRLADAPSQVVPMPAPGEVLSGENGVLVYDPLVTASVKVFERVEGARLTGRAAPGARVSVSLRLVGPGGGDALRYRAETRAAPDGGYEVVVPYATRDPAGWCEVVADGPYRVRVGASAEDAHVEVSEADVRAGLAVQVPAAR